MIARQKVAQHVILERPTAANHAQPLERGPVAGLPVVQQVAQYWVKLLFRWIPGFIQVVVDPRRIDGPDRRFGIGVSRQQYSRARPGYNSRERSRKSTPVMPGMRWSLKSSATGSWRAFNWAKVSRAAWPLAARITRYAAPYCRRRSWTTASKYAYVVIHRQ